MAGETFGSRNENGAGGVDFEEAFRQLEGVSEKEFTPEAAELGDEAEEFFKQRFPEMSEAGREARVEHVIQAGLSRMDGMKELEEKFRASRGEVLDPNYDEQLLNSMKLEMGRTMTKLYGGESRLVSETKGAGLGPNEEIAWSVAMVPHEPGTLDTVDLFMNNLQREGENADDYKQRLYNYRKHDIVRDNQIAEDAAYVSEHPETAQGHGELAHGMQFDMELKAEYPEAWAAIKEENGKVEAVNSETAEKENPLEGRSLVSLREETMRRMRMCENRDMQIELARVVGRLDEKIAQEQKAS